MQSFPKSLQILILGHQQVSPCEPFNEISPIWAFGAEGPIVNARHKALLRAWARQHRHWSVDDCKHVAWPDESHFQLNLNDACVWVWRQPHESMRPTY
ncbi:uncharacterized protein TNCV_742941 [Trichonephila clavipes]|nr:uncharacterized protein TNCV_742941 [Trichonephila clavipes]